MKTATQHSAFSVIIGVVFGDIVDGCENPKDLEWAGSQRKTVVSTMVLLRGAGFRPY